MKKFFTALVFIIVFAAGVFALSEYDRPKTNEAADSFVKTEDGTVYLFQNRSSSLRVYSITSDGKLDLYYETAKDDESGDSILAIDVSGEDVYFLKASATTPDAIPYIYTINKISDKGKTCNRVYEGIPDSSYLSNYLKASDKGLEVYGTRGTVIEGILIPYSGADDITIFSVVPVEENEVQFDVTAGKGDIVASPKLSFANRINICADRLVYYIIYSLIAAGFAALLFAGFVACRKVALKLLASAALISVAFLIAVEFIYFYDGLENLEPSMTAIIREDIFRECVFLAACFTAGFTLIYAIICVVICRPLWSIERKKRALKEDRDTGMTGPLPKNEFDRVWVELQRLATIVEKKNYNYNELVKSYNRFIPHTGIKLLNKSDVTEVSLGDHCKINGSIGTITFADDYKGEWDAEMANRIMHNMIECLEEENGGILTSSDSLMNFLIYNKEGIDSAIKFGVRFFEKLRDGQLGTNRAVIIFDNTDFIYSVVGTQNTALCGVSCGDTKYLAQYTGQLADAGVHMVITGRALEQMKTSVPTRYIGFLSDERTGWSEKIYEVIDTYPDKERMMMLAAQDKFAEGLQLLYKNNFYLARNAFSSVVRDCPFDGVARWYLFACEKYFNDNNVEKANYNLFGEC